MVRKDERRYASFVKEKSVSKAGSIERAKLNFEVFKRYERKIRIQNQFIEIKNDLSMFLKLNFFSLFRIIYLNQ
jgi:hypothetical protein